MGFLQKIAAKSAELIPSYTVGIQNFTLMAKCASKDLCAKICYALSLPASDTQIKEGNGVFGLYIKRPDDIINGVCSRLSSLDKKARKLGLTTNIEELKQQAKPLLQEAIQQAIRQHQPPMVETWPVILFSLLDRVEAKIHNASDVDKHIADFKKMYIDGAVQILKTVKVVFPKEYHMKFVDLFKNLQIKSTLF